VDDTALAPRGLASGTVGKLAGMVRIRPIGLIGSQVLKFLRMQFTDLMVVGWRHRRWLKIKSVPLERVLHEEAL
jgi:hypothetical protein